MNKCINLLFILRETVNALNQSERLTQTCVLADGILFHSLECIRV